MEAVEDESEIRIVRSFNDTKSLVVCRDTRAPSERLVAYLQAPLARPLGVSGVIIGTLVGYGITAPLYIRLVLRELSMGVAEFVTQAILPILPWAAVFAAVVALTAQLVSPASLIAVALCCVPGTLVYVAGVVRFAMTREERSALFGFLLPASRAR